ncbi:hypothetical protein CJ263_19175 [Maribacter cobaltidurans]|uniref:Uncharacterized protein n=1 Tax=Maribacter cobaltidurans TaxID=1178778 RepID=A0A223V9X6_9FLAO|nr:hypothetical protein CJ263_19175 [Maribacter cobaltidurans]
MCILYACNSHGKKDSSMDNFAEEAQLISNIATGEHEIITDTNTLREIQNHFIQICGRYSELDHKNFLYQRYAESGDIYGDVYFHNAKVSLVSWHDEALGLNGSYQCYFDENSEVVLIEGFNHDGQTCMATYYIPWNSNIVPFTYMGEFPKNGKQTFSGASYDKRIAASGTLGTDDYNTIVATAKKLLNAALEKNEATFGSRYYVGTIAEKYAIQANLRLYDSSIHGQYHYENTNRSLSIYGEVSDGSVQLRETNPETNEVTGHFTGTFSADGSISGSWFNADKTKELPFELRPSESYKAIDGTILQGLPQRIPEIYHQKIKTNYFDFPKTHMNSVEEVLGSNQIDPIPWGSGAEMKIMDFLQYYFVRQKEHYFNNYIDSDYGDIVTKYFNDIYLALPDFVSAKERHDGYYRDLLADQSLESKLIPYLVYRVDRSSENIFAIWNLYKAHFFDMVDMDTYKNLKLDRTVNDLLHSYDHLKKNPDHELLLVKAYQLTDSLNQQKIASDYEPGAYGTSAQDQHPFLQEIMQDDTASYHRKLWSYSFWMRRNHEGNTAVVASLLKEIKENYN